MAVPRRQALLLLRRGGSTKPSETRFGIIPPHDARGEQHLCFSITHNVLNSGQDHPIDFGLTVESRLDFFNGGSSLYARDSDGHSLEVATPGLWQNNPIEPKPPKTAGR